MSKTFDLVCPETGKAIWVGQRDYVYSSPEHLQRLAAWLHEHKGRPIFFVDEESPLLDEIDHNNWVGMEDANE
jgi:hypothetical protein